MKPILASVHPENIGLITSILLLLVLARLLGELMNRLKQSPVVGEILAGLLLGPAVFDIVSPSAELAGIAELSVFLILLQAGMEMDFKEVMKAFVGPAAILGAVSFIIPLIAGLVLGMAYGLGATQSVIMALCIAITALPVIVRVLQHFGLLESSVAKYSIATAVFNDITALFFLGVLLGLGGTSVSFEGLLTSVSQTGGKLLIFASIIFLTFVFMFLAGEKTGYIRGFLSKTISLFGQEALFGVAILFVLIFGSMSERLSSHFVIGVFFGGLLINRANVGPSLFKKLENTLNSISSGFLAPIFFAFIGLNFKWGPMTTTKGAIFAASIVVVSMGSKILAARIAGKLAKLSTTEAMGVGIALNSRGTMDLVVANIALNRGLIDDFLFSTLVLLGVLSTVATPMLFSRIVIPRKDELSSLGESEGGDPEGDAQSPQDPQLSARPPDSFSGDTKDDGSQPNGDSPNPTDPEK